MLDLKAGSSKASAGSNVLHALMDPANFAGLLMYFNLQKIGHLAFSSPKVAMGEICAASSLYSCSVGFKIILRKRSRDIVHNGPGFSTNPVSVSKSKTV